MVKISFPWNYEGSHGSLLTSELGLLCQLLQSGVSCLLFVSQVLFFVCVISLLFLRKLKSLRCFMSGSENIELAQQGKSLISYLLAAIAMGARKHGLANSFILSQANLYIERNCVLG